METLLNKSDIENATELIIETAEKQIPTKPDEHKVFEKKIFNWTIIIFRRNS